MLKTNRLFVNLKSVSLVGAHLESTPTLRSKTVSKKAGAASRCFFAGFLAIDAAFAENYKTLLDQTETEDSLLLEHKSGDGKGTVEIGCSK